MPRITRRSTIALACAAVFVGVAPIAVGLVSAQVRKCYSVICSTVKGETTCYEKEVPCPNEA
ncbi:MAG TPA: hypothetical protein VF006_09675 [Longimicrobium sp.]